MKTCKICKYNVQSTRWVNCKNEEILNSIEVPMDEFEIECSFTPPLDFCCKFFEEKETI